MRDKSNKADARLTRLNNLVDQVLADGELYRVDTRIKGSGGQPLVDVFIDGDQGVTIDQCAQVNRTLYASIELEDLFKSGFRLDVSSPGLGQPLRFPRQYRRHIGRELDVLVRRPDENEPVRVSGRLTDTEESGITLATNDERLSISFDEIVRAVVNPSFKTGLVQ